jgi:hypothetical protein
MAREVDGVAAFFAHQEDVEVAVAVGLECNLAAGAVT